jgi:hypothetical protein
MGGVEYEEEIVNSEPGEDAWEDEVEISFGAEEFRCPTCDLQLNGRLELESAGLNPDHVETEMRTRDYEPDYGNC